MFFIFSKKRFRCLCLIQSHKHSALKTKTGSVLLRSEITMWVCELYTVYYWIRSEQITDLQPRWFFACFYFFSHLDLDKLLMMSIHCWMLMLKQVQECQDELISSKILQKTSASFSWTSSATAAVISPGRKMVDFMQEWLQVCKPVREADLDVPQVRRPLPQCEDLLPRPRAQWDGRDELQVYPHQPGHIVAKC